VTVRLLRGVTRVLMSLIIIILNCGLIYVLFRLFDKEKPRLVAVLIFRDTTCRLFSHVTIIKGQFSPALVLLRILHVS